MKALFAMDLMGGKTVRLKKGDFSAVTVYSNNPVEKIKDMVDRGARDFHIIDLDGAREGFPVHFELIKRLRTEIKGYMEVGGGIRTKEDIKAYEDLGMDGIIVGTRPLEDMEYFKSLSSYRNIVLGLDVYNGKPMIKGWKEAVDIDLKDIITLSEEVGIKALLCTAIARDGMLAGPDFEGLERILNITRIPVIASGGVTTLEDIKRLKSMGVWATIIGKAFYEGLIRIEDVMGLVY